MHQARKTNLYARNIVFFLFLRMSYLVKIKEYHFLCPCRLFCARFTPIVAMSHIIDEDETYTYETLQEKHLEESTKLLAETFTKHNPLEVFLRTTYEQFYAQAISFSEAVLDEQLSIVAVHRQSEEVHGIVQAGDAKKMEGREFEAMKQAKDAEVYEELERRIREYYGELKENELVQILMAGVRPDCSGKGEFAANLLF